MLLIVASLIFFSFSAFLSATTPVQQFESLLLAAQIILLFKYVVCMC